MTERKNYGTAVLALMVSNRVKMPLDDLVYRTVEAIDQMHAMWDMEPVLLTHVSCIEGLLDHMLPGDDTMETPFRHAVELMCWHMQNA